MAQFSTADNFLSPISATVTINNIVGLSTQLKEKPCLDLIDQNPAPDPPDLGNVRLYSKTDKLYFKDSFGNEVSLGGGGVSLSVWKFDTTIVGAPADGYFKFNNATPAAVTTIHISILDDNNNSYRPIFEQFGIGDGIYFQDSTQANNKFYTVQSSTDNATYFSLNVTFKQETQAPPFTLNENISCSFFVSGSNFDQSLNTNDSVNFKGLSINDTVANEPSLTLKATDAATIAAAKGTLTFADNAGNSAADLQLVAGQLTLRNNVSNGGISIISGLEGITLDEITNETTFTTDINAKNIEISNTSPNLTIVDTDNTDQTNIRGNMTIKGLAGNWNDTIIGNIGQGGLTINHYPAGNSIFLRTNTQASAKTVKIDSSGNLIVDDGVFQSTAGSAAAPSITFKTDTNTGLYSGGADILGVAVNGLSKLLIDGTKSVFTNDVDAAKFLASSGTAAAPSITFKTDTDTGLYSGGADIVGLSAGGQSKLLINADDSEFYTNVNISSGHKYKDNGVNGLIVKTGLGGNNNYVVGNGAAPSLDTGAINNIAIGTFTGGNLNNGDFNILIGSTAGKSIINNSNNVCIGNGAGEFQSGNYNTVIGSSAGYGNGVSANIGHFNTLLGGFAGTAITTGSENVCLGYVAGGTIETGSWNTIIGRGANVNTTGANYRAAIGYNASSDEDQHMVIGSGFQPNTIKCIKPGVNGAGTGPSVDGCDLGTANKQFKDLYLAGSIILSNPPPPVDSSSTKNSPAVVSPTVINANEITTATIKCTAIEAEPSVTEITFNQPIVVQQGITIPPSAPPSEVDTMDIKTLKIKNATNNNTLTYSATSDQTLDLAQIQTDSAISQILPPTMTSNTLVNTDGTFTVSASSVLSGNEPVWKAFDDSLADLEHWSTNVNLYNSTTGVYTGSTPPTAGYSGEWIQLQLPFDIEVADYSISQRLGIEGRLTPSSWKLFISTDGTNWTEIDEKIDQPWEINGTQTQTFTPAVTGQTGSYLRLVVSKVGGSYGGTDNKYACQINELSFTSASQCPAACMTINNELHVTGDLRPTGNMYLGGGLTAPLANITSLLISNETNSNTLTYSATSDQVLNLAQIQTDSTISQILPPTMTSNTLVNTDGTFIVSASNTLAGNPEWKAFDDNLADPEIWSTNINLYNSTTGVYTGPNPPTAGYPGEWIQLQLPFDIEVADYSISQRMIVGGRLTPSSWKLFISSDGTNWTEIDEKVDQPWEVHVVQTQTFTPTVSGQTGSYLRLVVSKVGGSYGGTDNRYACQINELSFTSATACPSACMTINNELHVTGDLRPTGSIVGDGGITAWSNILQDTYQSAYGYAVFNDKVTPPSYVVPSPTGNITINNFDIARAYAYNTTSSVNSIVVDFDGIYEINVEGSFLANANGTYDLCIYVNGVCVTYTSTSDLKDVDSNRSVNHIQALFAGDIVDIRLADASVANISVSVTHLSLVVKRILVNFSIDNPPTFKTTHALKDEEKKDEGEVERGWFSLS